MKKRGHSELALFAWTLSKGDNNPWRCLMAKRQRFTKEFKVEAIWLWKSSGRPAAAVAREVGLRRNHLYKWADQAGDPWRDRIPWQGRSCPHVGAVGSVDQVEYLSLDDRLG